MKPYALYPETNGVEIRIHYAGPQGEILHVWKRGEPENQMVFPSVPAFHHRWKITGLQQDTVYEYGREGRGTEGSFRTLPENGKVRIAIFGDPQAHTNLEAVTSIAAKYKPNMAVCLGDIADGFLYLQFFRKSRSLLKQTAMIPTPGNHDYKHCSPPFNGKNPVSQMYNDWFGDGKLNCNATEFGQFKWLNIAFPDHKSLTEKCRQWLVRQLESARKKNQKVLISHHCPCFTSTTITWALDGETLPPLLDQYKDVVLADFAGHIHTYEYNIYPDDKGVWYITTGCAGELYDFPVKQVENPYEKSSADVYHCVILDLAPGSMRMRAVDIDGNVFDDRARKWSI